MMAEMKSYNFVVNSLEVEARYHEEDLREIFIPLLKTMAGLKKEKNRRILVFLAAPPGVGKTTLSLLLEHLSRSEEGLEEIQAIGIDGFHYPQEYIRWNTVMVDGKEVPMAQVKGSPESFDLSGLKKKIKELKEKNIKWPIYDRTLHDVVPDQVPVEKDIILIEGNWLLLDEEGWRDLKKDCDYSIFISAQEGMLRERLIQRKRMGGLKQEEAERFYQQSDRKNVIRVLSNSLEADLHINLTRKGKYINGR